MGGVWGHMHHVAGGYRTPCSVQIDLAAPSSHDDAVLVTVLFMRGVSTRGDLKVPGFELAVWGGKQHPPADILPGARFIFVVLPFDTRPLEPFGSENQENCTTAFKISPLRIAR